MSDLRKPKEVIIKDMDGGEHTYLISRLPYMAGRQVAAEYPVSNMPKVGNYKQSEEVMRLLFKHIHVVIGDGHTQSLATAALIENHVPDAPTGLKLEAAMLAYNFDFFGQGGLSMYLKQFLEKHLPSIMQTVIPLLPPSLVQELQAGLKSTKSST
jgi:hypothetical protein